MRGRWRGCGSPVRPGVVRLRALLIDPLTDQTQWTEDRSAGPEVWPAGIDADRQPVTIRSAGVSGVVVAGLAGYGKTSFLNARFCQLAGSAAVQFVLVDGKGGPDYDDLFARAWLCAKDDPQVVRDHLATVAQLLTGPAAAHPRRAGREEHVAPRPQPRWPLVVVVIDEAHTFFNEIKGSDADSRRLDALARDTIRIVEELIRKGRNVGIQVILATQKATADAIPTSIRDNCQVAVSFAQRTSGGRDRDPGFGHHRRPGRASAPVAGPRVYRGGLDGRRGQARIHPGPHPIRQDAHG